MRKVPGSRYVDVDFLAIEQRRIFERAWLMVGRSAELAGPGDYVAFKVGDVPVMVLRDQSGTLRAFRNHCRHRGTQLLAEGRGHVKAIRCPYHDWKYALDGRLRHVPGEELFEPLDKASLGLHPLRVSEAIGLIWVNASLEGPSLQQTSGDIFDEVAPYGLGEMTPVHEQWSTVPCNWKALLDNATESYHLTRVHGMTVDKHVTTRPGFRTYGDHYRLTLPIADYPWREWLDAATGRGGPYTPKQKAELHKYVLFPNFLMNVLPYHLTIFQVWPDGPDRCRFFYGFYERRGARGLEWLRVRATWLASRYILREDLAILMRFQDGVRAGRADSHRFHDDERALAHFHDVLTRWTEPEPD